MAQKPAVHLEGADRKMQKIERIAACQKAILTYRLLEETVDDDDGHNIDGDMPRDAPQEYRNCKRTLIYSTIVSYPTTSVFSVRCPGFSRE